MEDVVNRVAKASANARDERGRVNRTNPKGGKGAEGKRLRFQPDEGIALGKRTSLSFDANRSTLNLHVKTPERAELRPRMPARAHMGGHYERFSESPAWFHARVGGAERREPADHYIRNIVGEKDNETHSALALNRSLTPVTARYNSAFAQSEATTIMAKTKLPIGGLSYLQNEVLAVGIDPAGLERARALGFGAEPVINSEASDHQIVRLTVPSGLDALRGQDLLSRELPGQRFELNKVYRLYRASAREEPVTLDKSLPATAPGEVTPCNADRCFAKAAIGWKDELSQCAKALKVGILDTDIDESHPAFRARRIHRFDFSPDGTRPAPNWHGTAVLSLLAGSPLTSTPGLIPDAEFFVANVFYADERGDMAADTISLIKALDWMKAYDVRLINMSFAGPRDDLVGEAIERMSENGTVFVAAAGNEGPMAPPAYPAAFPQVIAVTAVTKDLRNYRYANRGDHIDVSAPGVEIWTAAPGNKAGYHSGTSFAAPYVTAVLAVEPPEILAQDKAALLDNLAVMDLGDEGRDRIYGRGLLLAPSECTPPEPAGEAIASAAVMEEAPPQR